MRGRPAQGNGGEDWRWLVGEGGVEVLRVKESIGSVGGYRMGWG